LELAKRLKEPGVKEESFFFWKTDEGDPYLVAHNSRCMNSKGTIEAAAFSVAELGEMLPKWIWICKDATYFCAGYALNPDPKKPMCEDMPPEMCDVINGATTEADAGATMLLYLIENKLATALQVPTC
jgi:hypothetical protein